MPVAPQTPDGPVPMGTMDPKLHSEQFLWQCCASIAISRMSGNDWFGSVFVRITILSKFRSKYYEKSMIFM